MDILRILLVVALVIFPALALTMRLALGPMVEALIRLRDGFSGVPASREAELRMERLEGEVKELRRMVARLTAAESFYRQLQRGELPEGADGGALRAEEASLPPAT